MATQKKPLYQPWNEDAFQSGMDVRCMTHIQRWMYKSLLQSSFFCSTSPYLPNKDRLLWMLAGAGSETEWKEHKGAVMECFAPHPDNPDLIGQHRVLEDWDRLVSYRAKMADLSKKAADARSAFAGEPNDDRTDTARTPHADQKKRNDKIRDLDLKENETKTIESEGEMSLKSNITDKCREILHTRIQTGDQSWAEVSSLARVYGASAVTEAFETWARASAGDSINYPLSVFVGKADAILAGEILKDTGGQDLINTLVYISNGEVVFEKKQAHTVGELLKSHTPGEIEAAFREFYSSVKDDFDRKHGGRKFSETAEQLLTLQKRRKAEALSQQAMIERVSQEGEARAAQELSEARKRADAEAEEVPDTLC